MCPLQLAGADQVTYPPTQCLDWNQSSIEFYERAGAANLSKAEGWLSFRMTREVMMAFVAK